MQVIPRIVRAITQWTGKGFEEIKSISIIRLGLG